MKDELYDYELLVNKVCPKCGSDEIVGIGTCTVDTEVCSDGSAEPIWDVDGDIVSITSAACREGAECSWEGELDELVDAPETERATA